MSITRGQVFLLAVGTGLTVACIYYNQPMLATLATELHASPSTIGAIPTATQLGYAAGILFLAPLGDRFDRRNVILVKVALLVVALLAAAAAPNGYVLAAASLPIGMLAAVAQDLVPAAATLAPAESRGKTVGSVMTGLLLGILLSRVVSGAVSAWVSWRYVFGGAAVTLVLLGAVLRAKLPSFTPTTDRPYFSLLASMVGLFRGNAPLRRAVLTQSLLAFAFSGFWSTLALGLAAPPFHLSSLAAGAFGIAGAAGALAAPIAGSIADQRGPVAVVRVGAALVLISFVGMALVPGSILSLVLGAIVFDLGTQACLIAHQTIVYAQDPNARSRLNAILVSGMFFSMSAGAFSASHALCVVRAPWRLRDVRVRRVPRARLALSQRRVIAGIGPHVDRARARNAFWIARSSSASAISSSRSRVVVSTEASAATRTAARWVGSSRTSAIAAPMRASKSSLGSSASTRNLDTSTGSGRSAARPRRSAAARRASSRSPARGARTRSAAGAARGLRRNRSASRS